MGVVQQSKAPGNRGASLVAILVSGELDYPPKMGQICFSVGTRELQLWMWTSHPLDTYISSDISRSYCPPSRFLDGAALGPDWLPNF